LQFGRDAEVRLGAGASMAQLMPDFQLAQQAALVELDSSQANEQSGGVTGPPQKGLLAGIVELHQLRIGDQRLQALREAAGAQAADSPLAKELLHSGHRRRRTASGAIRAIRGRSGLRLLLLLSCTRQQKLKVVRQSLKFHGLQLIKTESETLHKYNSIAKQWGKSATWG